MCSGTRRRGHDQSINICSLTIFRIGTSESVSSVLRQEMELFDIQRTSLALGDVQITHDSRCNDENTKKTMTMNSNRRTIKSSLVAGLVLVVGCCLQLYPENDFSPKMIAVDV